MQLATIGPLQIAAAFRIWEKHAPPKLAGILTGNGWRWDPAIQGYRSSDGKIVAGAKLKELALQVSDAIREDMRKRAGLLAIGAIPAWLWRHQMGVDVAGAAAVMAALAAGGFHELTPAMKNVAVGTPRVPGGLSFSLDRLARWGRALDKDEAKAVETGEEAEPEGMSPQTRAELYGSAINTIFEGVKRESHKSAVDADGKRAVYLEINRLDDEAQHCHTTKERIGCPQCTAMGWVKVGTLPLPGLRQCGPKCRCWIDYSEVGSEEKPSAN